MSRQTIEHEAASPRNIPPEPEDAEEAHSTESTLLLRETSRHTITEGIADFAKACNFLDQPEFVEQLIAQLQIDESSHSTRVHNGEPFEREIPSKWNQPKTLYFVISICSLGAIEQGWAQTSMNGANLYFPKQFGIGSGSPRDNFLVGLINSGIFLSCGILGALLSEPVNRTVGRRGAIFTGTLLCLLGSLASALSRSWIILLLSRFILGTGMGFNASTVSVYAAECAPPMIRGGLAVSWQMFTAFGVFLGFVANVAVFDVGPNIWRWQLAAPILPALPLLGLVLFCPESPAWYLKSRGQCAMAYQSLCRLRNTPLIAAKELYPIFRQQQAVTLMAKTKKSLVAQFLELFTIPRIRRATVASYAVMLSQQLCGINIIAFYSSSIFADAGFTEYGALVASVFFGLVNFIGAFPAVWTMDSLGRRSLLLLTLPIMALIMLAAGLTFSIPSENPAHSTLLAVLIYIFCAAYSPGMGPVPCAYSAEVFPLSHRELGMSFAISVANLWATLLSFTFPRITAVLQARGVFFLYGALNVVAFVLVFLFVPETRLKSLNELDEVFDISTKAYIHHKTNLYIPRLLRR